MHNIDPKSKAGKALIEQIEAKSEIIKAARRGMTGTELDAMTGANSEPSAEALAFADELRKADPEAAEELLSSIGHDYQALYRVASVMQFPPELMRGSSEKGVK